MKAGWFYEGWKCENKTFMSFFISIKLGCLEQEGLIKYFLLGYSYLKKW